MHQFKTHSYFQEMSHPHSVRGLYCMYLTAQTTHYCKGVSHKVHIYQEYHSVCTLVRIGTPPPPCKRVSPPGTKGGGHARQRVREWRSQFGRLKKSLALCLFCGVCCRTAIQKLADKTVRGFLYLAQLRTIMHFLILLLYSRIRVSSRTVYLHDLE